MKALWNSRLFTASLLCCALSIFYSHLLYPYVMPNLDKEELSLAERLTSTSFGDSSLYATYADKLISSGGFTGVDGNPVVRHMPGFPLVLATVLSLFRSPRAFLVFQSVFFFLSLYFFLVRIQSGFKRSVLFWILLILTFHPLLIRHFTGVMSDLLFSSLLLWIAFVLWKDSPNTKDFVLAGLLFGLAVYFRESAFIFVAMVALAYVIKDHRQFTRPSICMVVVFLVLLGPWVVRNYIQTHRFIPLTTKGAELFYFYSIPLTTSLYNPRSATFNFELLYKRPNQLQVKSGNTTELFKRGLENYISKPADQLVSLSLKTVALFNRQAFLGRDLSSPRVSVALLIFNVFYFGFHVLFILGGIILSFRGKLNPFVYLPYLIVAQYLQAILFSSEPRYLMPFYPFLLAISLAWYGRVLAKYGAAGRLPFSVKS